MAKICTMLAVVLGMSLNCLANTVAGYQTTAEYTANTIISPMLPKYGAKCDGKTDDSKALQAAIIDAEATNHLVVIPPQVNCVFSKPLRIDGRLIIQGVDQSQLTYTGKGNAFVMGLNIKKVPSLDLDGLILSTYSEGRSPWQTPTAR